MQAAVFARLAGTDAVLLQITYALADQALQLQPHNAHFVSLVGLREHHAAC